MIDDYLVLHRIRTADPVTHEIFHEGSKVGSVTEVAPSIRTGRLAGRNSFAFESTGDRFIVHLTQPDGTRIRATTEYGRFLNQVVERTAAVAAPLRSGVGVAGPLAPSLEAVGSSLGPPHAGESGVVAPQLARPQEAKGSIMMEEPAPRAIVALPDTVPLPRPSPPRTRHAIGATPGRTVGFPAGNRRAPEQVTVTPATRPKPITTSGSAPLAAAAAAPYPVAPASAPAASPKSVVTSVNAAPPFAAPALRSLAPVNAAPTAGSKRAAAVATEPLAATPAKPRAPAAKPKPALAIENAQASPKGAKPVAPAARPSRSPLSDPSVNR
jgi:hypothetical protein